MFQSQSSAFVFRVLDNRCIFHELEQYSCLRISYNSTNSCPEQDTPVSVQNDSYSSSLTITNMVLRGSTTTCLSCSLSRLHSFQTINTSKGKFQHQNLPVFNRHTWELSKNQFEIEISQTLQFLSPNQANMNSESL